MARLGFAHTLLPLLAVLTLSTPAIAAVTTYTDEAAFLAAIGSWDLESFETLPAAGASNDPVVADHLTLTPVETWAVFRVADQAFGGHHATHGTQYVVINHLSSGDPAPGPVEISLVEHVTSFGFSITDWGDVGFPGELTLTIPGEAPLTIAVSPPESPDGSERFFGVVRSDAPFNFLTLTTTTQHDVVGIDEIYLGVACFGDLNGDNEVNLSDLAALLANYGATSGMTYLDGDLDADGDIDLSDLAALLAEYGTVCT